MNTNKCIKKNNITAHSRVKVSEPELSSLKRFFNDHHGSKRSFEIQTKVSAVTLWRFLDTGKGRPSTINKIRDFVKNYSEPTI